MSAPLFCTTCNIAFDSAVDHRQHAKDDWHIYKLRCRVAPPGTIIPEPSALQDVPETDLDEDDDDSSHSSVGHRDDDDDDDDDDDGDGESQAAAPECVPGQCLFCGDLFPSFDANAHHMLKAHSLIIPYQDFLAVQLETLLWYLHLVIYGYHECILCGTRRHTTEAVQQHMLAKGHCRFDLSGDVADFYDMPSPKSEYSSGGSMQTDRASLRLSSGKLLGHRSQGRQLSRSRLPGLASEGQSGQRSVSHEAPSNSTTLERQDRKLEVVTAQLSRLSAGDRSSLRHLPVSEQRSVLAIRKKQMDSAQRREWRDRLHLERLGNKTLMKSFKPDVPGRKNG